MSGKNWFLKAIVGTVFASFLFGCEQADVPKTQARDLSTAKKPTFVGEDTVAKEQFRQLDNAKKLEDQMLEDANKRGEAADQ